MKNFTSLISIIFAALTVSFLFESVIKSRLWSSNVSDFFRKKHLPLKYSVVAVLFMLLSVNGAWGQTAFTATYTFGSSGDVSSFTYNGTNYAGIVVGAINKVGVTSSSSSNNFRATDWPTSSSVDLAKYIGLTISANSGYQFTVTSITFGIGRSGTGTIYTQWRGGQILMGQL